MLIVFGFALNPKVRHLRGRGVPTRSTKIRPQSRAFIHSLTENINFDLTDRFVSTEDANAALGKLRLDLFMRIPPNFTAPARPNSLAMSR